MLTVRNAPAAVEFYANAFAATEEERFTAPTGHQVVRMSIEGVPFFVVDENLEAFNLSPESLGGTSVRINLMVEDPDACAARAIDAGATVLFAVTDQPYGLRQGRVQDPYGHHWLIAGPLTNV